MKLPLTVALITYNEEKNLPKTLEAINDIASEIVIIDSHSKDKTVEIAKSYDARVFIEDWKGFRDQKNSLIKKCTQKWILFLDADEVVSEELKKEIVKAVTDEKADGFMLNRKTFYAGKFLNHVWQPDWVLRLVKKESNPRWEGGNIHEYLSTNGKVLKLKGFLYHYSYKNIYEHCIKSIKYAKLSAEEMYKNGKRFKFYKLILNPTWAFIKQYFIQRGFLDGIRGLSIAFSYLTSTFLKYLFLWELHIRRNR